MNTIHLFALTALLSIMGIAHAHAQGTVVQCGVPEKASLETDPANEFCDIYQRQLSYKETVKTLKQDLLTRQENYAKPRKQAYEQYRKDLEAMHNQEAEAEAQAE